MSDTIVSLKRKMSSAGDLLGVVRTMKAMTASNITQFERAVSALDDYYRTVQLGLAACFRQTEFTTDTYGELLPPQHKKVKTGVLVFGSDQGLVGQFNDSLAEFLIADLAEQMGDKIIWVVGERLQSRLTQTDLNLKPGFELPKAIDSITPLVGEILLEMETYRSEGKINEVIIFHNQPGQTLSQSGSIYAPIKQRLLPLDAQWQQDLVNIPWPTANLPEVIDTTSHLDQNDYYQNKNHHHRATKLALIHEYLFVSLYRACAESLASENASRLAAMQRAEKNIDELLLTMNGRFHSLRQSGIDEELFDVISGFNALSDAE
jgi:F-type H+-transporting ATPase subunit gamma